MNRLITFTAILVAIACRGWLHLTTALVPGMNGGYYLVQARSLIEKGALAIPDLPLVFTLHACLAWMFHQLTGMDINRSVIMAVKAADSVLPALAIFPVMLLARAWWRDSRSCIEPVIAAVAGIAITAGAAALAMVGEFEKNSLGLALLCGLAWAMRRWIAQPGAGRLATAVLLLGLIGITHIGVFGTALVFTGTTLLMLALARGREGWRRVSRLALAALPVAAAAAVLVFWKFDPSRVRKLLHALSEPADYLTGGPGPGGPSMADNWMQYLPAVLVALVALTAAVVAWRKRRDGGLADAAVICGAALTAVALTGPWVHGDKVMRFTLNAMPLTLLCLLFALLRIPHKGVRGAVSLVVLGALLAPVAPRLLAGGQPIITEAAKAELSTLAASVEDPAHTLIVARHGLEWWTAWTLHTHIAQPQAVTAEDWKRFKYVWFIEQKQGMGRPSMFGMFNPGRPPGGGPGGPPPFGRGMGPPPGMPRGPGRPPGPGGMMGAPMPEEAVILHEGTYFKLGWVVATPFYITQRESSPLDVFGDLDAALR